MLFTTIMTAQTIREVAVFELKFHLLLVKVYKISNTSATYDPNLRKLKSYLTAPIPINVVTSNRTVKRLILFTFGPSFMFLFVIGINQ